MPVNDVIMLEYRNSDVIESFLSRDSPWSFKVVSIKIWILSKSAKSSFKFQNKAKNIFVTWYDVKLCQNT